MIKINRRCIFNKEQLKIGRKVEMEHTNSTKIATRIAKQHLCEYPKYYTELIKMEKKWLKQ